MVECDCRSGSPGRRLAVAAIRDSKERTSAATPPQNTMGRLAELKCLSELRGQSTGLRYEDALSGVRQLRRSSGESLALADQVIMSVPVEFRGGLYHLPGVGNRRHPYVDVALQTLLMSATASRSKCGSALLGLGLFSHLAPVSR